MLNFTPIVRPFFTRRAGASISCHTALERTQRRQLIFLLKKGRRTLQGERADYGLILSRRDVYESYAAELPVVSYEDIRADVMRMIGGEKDILWPGRTLRYAQSSGTSGGRSKYVPVTDDSLRLNHYRGGFDVVAQYLRLYPDSRIFAGKSFILGGSFENSLGDLSPSVKVGDLSANLIEGINPLANLVRVPRKEIALIADWQEKLPALVRASAGEDITNISGVPSWFMTVLREVMKSAGASSIHDVWPNLEVFFHGGISFDPYRSQYAGFTDPARMHYLETYNASEGFFAVQARREPGRMMLLIDDGIFYEFIPVEQTDDPDPEVLPAWKVEEGKTYALVISACNGLWRYAIGDTVKIESVEPVLTISIAGRTKCYINAFGEELMVYNAEAAFAEACRRTGASAENYTAGPVYAEGGQRGRHRWLIEWNTPPQSSEEFADILDAELCHVNSDYNAKRSHNIFLDRLSVVDASPGLFDRWLASTGKLGGQRKVPRLSNDPTQIDKMLKYNN